MCTLLAVLYDEIGVHRKNVLENLKRTCQGTVANIEIHRVIPDFAQDR
jgi:hypothetical protein